MMYILPARTSGEDEPSADVEEVAVEEKWSKNKQGKVKDYSMFSDTETELLKGDYEGGGGGEEDYAPLY